MNELPSRPPQKIIRHDDALRWVEGYAFLQAAREESNTIRANTRRIVEKARSEGLAQGRDEGLEQASALLAQTSAKVDDYLAGLETSMADLALGIVRQMLEPMGASELLLGCTRKALAAFRDSQALTLHVAPTELEALRNQIEPALAARLTLEADASVEPGQARLSSAIASVELGVEVQLRAIRQSLLLHTSEPQA
jgi:type III secretion protein L